MPGGRPSEYDPAFCGLAEETLGRGYSLAVLAGEIGVSRQTVDTWQNAHPEFLDAIKRGRAKGARIWEDRLANLADSGTGNATAIIFGLKNRLTEDWRDKTETEHSGGVEIKTIQRTLVDPRDTDR
jgi:hypothetical protein